MNIWKFLLFLIYPFMAILIWIYFCCSFGWQIFIAWFGVLSDDPKRLLFGKGIHDIIKKLK